YAYVRTLPAGAYSNLTVSEDVVFSGNTAGNGAFLPPTNPEITDIAVPAIGNGPSAGVPGLLTNSVQRHTLNNFDINFSYERPEVSITKVAPATTTPNAALTYTLTIQNTGNVTLTDLDVTDTLPTQLTNPRGLQYPTGVTAGFTGQTLDATITSLAPNASVTITFVATVNASAGTTITNTATVNVPSMTGVNAQSTAITTVQSSGGNGPTEPEMTKLPDRLTANVGGTISWTLQGFHNRSGNAVTDFTVIDTPGRGLNFSSGRLPAFTGGAGITYEIRYRVDGSNVWHVHATGIDASSAHNFSLPQPGNLHYTEIGFFFGDVPANFGLNNEIVMTFRVGADAPNNQLINRFLVSYNNTERQGGGPNDPVVVPPGGSVGGGGGGTIIENPRVALEEFFSPYHNSFLIGAPDGTIRPHGNITRAEVTTVLFRLLDDNFRAARWSQQNQFSDVHTNQWFNNAVSTMANANIVNGNPDGTFRPNDSITRAEFAAMLARFFDGVTPTGQNTFTDTSGHWAENYINMLADFGWVQGDGSGRFNPNGQMTRAEAAAIVNRMLDRVLGSTDDLLDGRTLWPDTPNQNAWYYLYMQEASHSTEFERRANSTLRWTEILPHLDWSVLERPQSRPGDITTAREQQRN
ncbi:MAG: S-layer homology domain-containing protein, partial [Clostridiales bacterium]|nr:S-layer homology domain-containing protein [Clostridiales bacterium]